MNTTDLVYTLFSITLCLSAVLVVTMIVVAILMLLNIDRSKVSEGWGALAKQTGLTLAETPGLFAKMPEVHGNFDGRAVRLWTHVVRYSHRSRMRYAVMQMALNNPANHKLLIHRDGVLYALDKTLFGVQDVEVGDAAFDKDFLIRSTPDTAAKSLFGSAMVRDAVRRIIPGAAGTLEIEGSAITYRPYRLVTDVQALYPVLLAMRDIANGFEGKALVGIDAEIHREVNQQAEFSPFEPSPTKRSIMGRLRTVLIGLFLSTILICLAGAIIFLFLMPS